MSTVDSIYRSRDAQSRVLDWCDRQLDAWPVPHSREVWETDAGSTHLLFTGAESASYPVIFVPGTNFNAASCFPEIEQLSRSRQVVTTDVPGQPGLSDARRERSNRIPRLGAWLADIVDRLNRPVILVGHSMGAAVVTAASSPLVAGRVLLSPAGIRRLKLPPRPLWSALRWTTAPSGATARRMLEHMCGPGQHPTPTHVEWMALVGHTTRTSLAPPPLPTSLMHQAAQQPRIVATGAHDIFLPPAHLRRLTHELLGVEIVTLPCGHLLDEKGWTIVSDLVAEL